MSFDIHFIEAPPSDALTADAAAAIARVMQKHGGPAKPEKDGWFFTLPDGETLEFYGGVDSPGGMLALRGFSEQLAALMLDLLAATGWAALVTAEDLIAIATQVVPLETVMDEDACPLVIVASAEDVGRAIAPGFTTWQAYRDEVATGPRERFFDGHED